MRETVKNNRESVTGTLFGKLFSAYDDKSFQASLEMFARRFEENEFPLPWFQGKKCLDVGCGGGRYSMAMAGLGAGSVQGIDIGADGIDDARKRAKQFGLDNVEFQVGSADSLPFDSESFDAVIFNGVLQHTAEPIRALNEVSRVVRPDGMIYLLVYATEGLRWPLVQMLRPYAAHMGFSFFDRAIGKSGLAVNRRRTYLDDLFVPYIDFYSWPCLRGLLEERGFKSIERWSKGRLDHEENLETYRTDLAGFGDLFQAAAALAETEHSSNMPLLRSACELIDRTLACLDAISDSELDINTKMSMAMGQGHHRVLAWRGTNGESSPAT